MSKKQVQTKEKKLPDFSKMTDKEIAEFWDTHSFVDYWDEMEEVEVTFEHPTEMVSIRMEKPDIEFAKRIAKRMGLGYSTLLRVWIKEKIRELQGAKS